MPTFTTTFSLSLFVRALGVVYFFALLSLFREAKGLYGTQGILPIRTFLKNRPRLPTLFLISTSDNFIQTVIALGLLASVLLALGVYPPIMIGFLIVVYLSFVVVGQEFMSFQWDMLLLETSYMAFFVSLSSTPSFFMLLALWIFLFRFTFSSGIVKLLSGDPRWQSLRALEYHYETQPIPNRLSWYFHQLPAGVHRACTAVVFFVELVVPFFIFAPEPIRIFAFGFLVFFQIVLILSGNLSFLNYLTIVLCIPLLSHTAPANTSYALDAIGLFYIAANLVHILRFFFPKQWMSSFLRFLSSLHWTSSYGLFAVMTTSRFELVIQGSDDGQDFKPYEFHYKPGNLFAPPKQIAPLHPRVDWQLWFAALRPNQLDPWIHALLSGLLEGKEDILRFFKSNPFFEKPPRYVRVVIYQYHFTNLHTRATTGCWWERTFVAEHPPMELVDKSHI